MRLQEVANRTGLPKATVLRFLRTLTTLRYVSYDGESKLYSLSPRVMSLGYTALSGMDVRTVALPFLEQLSETIGQNVNLGILDGIETIYIERIKKRQILNIDLEVGSRLKAHKTSIGLAIIAHMEKSESEATLKEILCDPEARMRWGPKGRKMRNALDEIRRKGYALNDETYERGLRAIGAPVFNHKGVADGGINIPVFAHQVSKEELIERYAPLLMSTAAAISAARGFRKDDRARACLTADSNKNNGGI
jgi:IclR family pca regulon transcriptional regulator